MTVLILSEEFDPTVDHVVAMLRGRDVPVFRMDLGWFPEQLDLDAELDGGRWVGLVRTSTRETRLEGLRSVWYRSPTAFTFPGDMPQPRREHAEREARFGLGGVLMTLPARWMNHPQRDADHAYKPRQLAIAAHCGLSVPRTIVTNDPDAVRRFARSTRHGLVIKVMASNVIYEDGHRKFAYTHRLTDRDLADLDDVALTAHQIQEWVPKAHDVRLTVVGTSLFAVSIHTDDPEARVDFRANYDALDYRSIDVPAMVAERVHAFMTMSGLTYSAIDFVVATDGRWVFLESNSGGQYGWLASTLGSAINDAIADVLAHESHA